MLLLKCISGLWYKVNGNRLCFSHKKVPIWKNNKRQKPLRPSMGNNSKFKKNDNLIKIGDERGDNLHQHCCQRTTISWLDVSRRKWELIWKERLFISSLTVVPNHDNLSVISSWQLLLEGTAAFLHDRLENPPQYSTLNFPKFLKYNFS